MSVKTSALSPELQALAVSDACVRISLISTSVKAFARFKALSIALISNRWARTSLSSSLHSPVVTLSIRSRSPFVGCASHLPHHHHVNLPRPMHAPHQDLLDIRRAAGAGDQHHGTGLRGRIGQDREQLVEAR